MLKQTPVKPFINNFMIAKPNIILSLVPGTEIGFNESIYKPHNTLTILEMILRTYLISEKVSRIDNFKHKTIFQYHRKLALKAIIPRITFNSCVLFLIIKFVTYIFVLVELLKTLQLDLIKFVTVLFVLVKLLIT